MLFCFRAVSSFCIPVLRFSVVISKEPSGHTPCKPRTKRHVPGGAGRSTIVVIRMTEFPISLLGSRCPSCQQVRPILWSCPLAAPLAQPNAYPAAFRALLDTALSQSIPMMDDTVLARVNRVETRLVPAPRSVRQTTRRAPGQLYWGTSLIHTVKPYVAGLGANIALLEDAQDSAACLAAAYRPDLLARRAS